MTGRRGRSRWPAKRISGSSEKIMVMKAKNDTTVESVFENWLNEKIKLNEISEATYWRYRRDFKRFFCDERDFSGRKISEVTYADVEAFLRSIISQGLTAKTFGNARVLVYGIFKRAKREGLISWSITQLIGDMEISRRAFKKTIKNDYQEVFSDEEMHTPHGNWKCLILAGLRDLKRTR